MIDSSPAKAAAGDAPPPRDAAHARQSRTASPSGEAAGERLPSGLYRYVWRVSGRDQIWLSLLSVAVFLLDLVPLELQRRIVNDALYRREIWAVAVLCFGYATVILAHGGLKLALNVYRSRVSEAANRRLRLQTDAAARAAAVDGSPRPAAEEGVRISIVVSEVEPVGGFIGSSVSEPVLQGGILLSVFGYMLVLQPWMALVALALFSPQLVFVPLLQAAINRRTKARIKILRQVSVGIVDDATGGDTDFARDRAYDRRVDRVYELNMEIYRRKYAMNFLMNALHHLGTVGILLVGGWFVIQGQTEVGTVVAFISGLNRVNDPWGDLVKYFQDMTNARVKYRLIATALNERAPGPGLSVQQSRPAADRDMPHD